MSGIEKMRTREAADSPGLLVDSQAHLIRSKVEDFLHIASRSARAALTSRMERSLKRDKFVLSSPASEHGVPSGSQSWGPASLKVYELTDRQTDRQPSGLVDQEL